MDQCCSACEDSHPATQRCVDCNDYFCESASKTHLRLKATSNHQIISVKDFHKTHLSRHHLEDLQFKSCPKHSRPFEFLNLNCHTHNHLLCSDCLIGDLPSLNLVRLGESSAPLMAEKLEHIRELDTQGRKHLCELREEEALLSSRLLEVAESKARSLREIRGVFVSLREALDVRERALEQEVEDLSKSVSFSLQEERERSRVWQGQLSVLGECVEELEAWVQSQTQTRSQVQSQVISSLLLKLTCLDKSLMVDVCLLEDALCNALSSSQKSCTQFPSILAASLEDKNSSKRARVDVEERVPSPENLLTQHQMPSHPLDGVNFTFCFSAFSYSPSKILSSFHSSSTDPSTSFSKLLEGISGMGSVTSSSSSVLSSVPPVDWSVGSPQHVLSFYSKGKGPNQLYHPFSLTNSPISKLFYIADSHNHRIQVFRNNPEAEIEGRLEIEYLPSFQNLFAFETPSCVCYHEGLLFIVEFENHQVHVCREDGSLVRSLGTEESGDGDCQFSYPSSCTVYDNHLFVSEEDNNRIQKFSLPDLTHVLSFGEDQLSQPCGLVIFNGKLYVTDLGNDRISVFDPMTGQWLYVIGPSLSNKETLNSPRGLLVSHDLLFVSSNHRISVLNTNDQCLYSFGSKGSGENQFSSPSGMMMVGERLFVCDSDNNRIQVFEQS